MPKIDIYGIKELQKKLDAVSDGLFTKQLFSRIGFKMREVIDARTEKGLDANDHRFMPYTKKYMAKKRDRGGKFFSSVVNLNDKGNMMSAMTHIASNNDVILGFNKTKEALKAHGHTTGGGRNKKREFFSVGLQGKKEINKIIALHLNALIND